MKKAVGYINEAYLKSSSDTYQSGQLLKASVLYLEPVTKIIQFTIGTIEDRGAGDLQKGSITTAQVGITTVLLKFNPRYKLVAKLCSIKL